MEFAGDQVLIEKHGDQLTVRPKPRDWADYFATCGRFDADFPADIDDQPIGEEALGW
jgi:virulence-associated protein VagC